ncbi:MAG: hypothetical protein R8G60_01385 [Roseovarius pacificus]|nr:hypothetical protein [Roseovarius pacificus]
MLNPIGQQRDVLPMMRAGGFGIGQQIEQQRGDARRVQLPGNADVARAHAVAAPAMRKNHHPRGIGRDIQNTIERHRGVVGDYAD